MLDKTSSRWLRKVQMVIVICHLRKKVTWIHRKRITYLTPLHVWMVKYFDPLTANMCLCVLLLLWPSLFLVTPSPQTLGSLSKDVLKQCTSTRSRALSLLICLDACNKFVLCGSRKYPYHPPPPPTEGIGFSSREGGSICLIFQWGGRVTTGKYFQRVLVTRKRVTKKKHKKFNTTIYLRRSKTRRKLKSY